MVAPRLILVLGDQLTPELTALIKADKDRDVVVMAEVRDEATYVRHHVRKIAFTFSAMRHFAEELRADGWQVAYGRYDDDRTAAGIAVELARRAEEFGAESALMTECGEHRLNSALAEGPLPVEVLPDDRFIASHAEFDEWAEARKQLRMEYFYREMRRKTGILMDGDKPEGGKWNYDADNRKPAQRDLTVPKPWTREPDEITREVLAMVAEAFSDHPGTLEPFALAVDRKGAEAAADHFFAEALPCFGDYQDAMLEGEPFLYHSLLSTYLNAGLLDPLDLCRRAEAEYRAGRAPLNAVEGYVRQILGWREYVRGIYFREGPDYVTRNALGAQRDLPWFYWDAEATDMACLKAAIGQTLEHGYAHHIQRLMITGTFALLAGVDPQQLHEWYLAVYTDAYEWVEAPNTLGMSQYADGGLLASKPYAASGNYIDRMSDYCKGCAYDVKTKRGEGACPFNPLYWDFLDRNRDRLHDNPRMAQMYRTWDRMKEDNRAGTRDSAAAILDRLDRGDRL